MRRIYGAAILSLGCGFFAVAAAQPPGGRKDDAPKAPERAESSIAKRIIDSLMVFDKNKDGKVTKEEMTDRRLQRLFDRADANKDGIVTKEELTAEATRLAAELKNEGRPGRNAPAGGRPRPPSGKRDSGAATAFRPGDILPAYLQDILKLTDTQKKQLAELQKETDTKLEKILTAEQKKQLNQMRELIRNMSPGPGDGKRPPRPPRP